MVSSSLVKALAFQERGPGLKPQLTTFIGWIANLVLGVLGLFGQRVSARRDSDIMEAIFPENTVLVQS